MPRDTFRKLPTAPPAPQPADDISLLRKLLAGGARVGSGILSAPGGWLGAGISGGGEAVAQAIEQVGRGPVDPNVQRIGVEAGIGAIPFGRVIKGASWLADALKSGVLTGTGEALREAYSGEDRGFLPDVSQIDPKSTALATLLGGATGGLVSKFAGPAAPAATKPEDFVLETTAQPGGQVLTASGKGTQPTPMGQRRIPSAAGAPEPTAVPRPRVSREIPYRMEAETIPGQARLPFEAVEELGGIPYGAVDPAPYRTAARAAVRADEKAAQEAAKIAENQARLDEIERMVAEGGLEAQPPRIAETITAETPLGKTKATTTYAPPEEEVLDELSELLSTGKVSRGGQRWKNVRVEDVPTEGPAREIFEAWLSQGKTPRQALKLAAKGRPPVGSGIETPGTRTISETFTPRGAAQVPAAAPVAPQVAEAAAPAVARAAEGVTPVTQQDIIESMGSAFPSDFSRAFPQGVYRSEELPALPSEVFGAASEIAEAVTPRVAPEATEGIEALARLFKSPLEAAGEGYGAIKQALAAGEAVPEEARRIAGQAAQRLRREAGLPPPAKRAPAKVQPVVESEIQRAVPAAPASAQEFVERMPVPTQVPELSEAGQAFVEKSGEGGPLGQLRDLVRLIDALKREGVEGPELTKTLSGIGKLRGDEKGELTNELMMQLGLGVGGAVVGGAVDPLDEPLLSAAAGATAGAFGPQLALSAFRKIGTSPEAIAQAEASLGTAEGIRGAADKIFRALPQLQRFNFLADAAGLPANAIAGPYGSALMGAIEHSLAGDPRGLRAIAELNPFRFIKTTVLESPAEARKLLEEGDLGRAEQGLLESGPELLKNVIRTPGLAMTSGDITARNALMRAGFTEAEARRITLTSEPESAFFHSIAETGKRSPLLQLLFPFRRTPANIAEQGLQRTPGIGSFMQLNREVPDPLRQQLVQQLVMTPAAGALGYASGVNLDPESAKLARRYVSNLGGQYSLPAGLGFAIGQAVNRGTPVSATLAREGVESAMPLPATDTIEDLVRFLAGGGEGDVPRGLTPSFLRNTFGIGVEEAPPSLSVRSSFRRPR